FFVDETVGTLVRVENDGPGSGVLASGLRVAGGLWLTTDTVYFADAGLGEIRAVDRKTGAETLLISGLVTPQRVLLRDDTLYVLELGTEASGYTDGALASAGIDGGSPVRLLTGLAAPHALAGA